MTKITVSVDGQQKLVSQMGKVAAGARARVKRALQMLGLMLVSHIQKTKLSGQRLHQRSGRLSGSIHEETEELGDEIQTTVGTNVVYARVHEFGFQGPSGVKAHMRTIKQAWGRPISPREALVRPHFRGTNMAERRYMRDSLAEFKPTAESVLQKLANKMAKEAAGQ